MLAAQSTQRTPNTADGTPRPPAAELDMTSTEHKTTDKHKASYPTFIAAEAQHMASHGAT